MFNKINGCQLSPAINTTNFRAYPEYECRSLGTGLLIFSVLSLYIEKGAKEKEVYNQTAKSLNKIYKELKALYLEIDESNIKESMDKLKSIDSGLEDICHSNHIPLLTNWLSSGVFCS